MALLELSPIEGSTDDTARINAALADPNYDGVVLAAGTYLVSSAVLVPSDKTLIGAGRDLTMIKAAPDFAWLGGDNGVVSSVLGATGVELSDFSIDASKLRPGGERLVGCFMQQATDFQIERVDVYNTTAYGHFAQGDANNFTAYASGTYLDCATYNCQIGFEQMTCDGVLVKDCFAGDGDGDIPSGGYFHPLTGSKNITFENCVGIGNAFTGFESIANLRPLENIQVIDCWFETLGGGSAFVASGQFTTELFIENSTFISAGQIGVRLGGVTGSAIDSVFQGLVAGIQFNASGNGTFSNFAVENTDALGLRDPAGTGSAFGVFVYPQNIVTWDGGTIEARGPAGRMFPIAGELAYTPATILIANDPPVINQAIADQSVAEDALWGYTVPSTAFVDEDSPVLTYAATLADGSPLPAWLSFDPASRTFSGTPPLDFNGFLDLKVAASDGPLSTSDIFRLTVTPVNDAPELTGTQATLPSGTEDTPYTIAHADLLAGYTDRDGDSLSIAGLIATNGTATDQGNGTWIFVPNANYNGAVALSYSVTDGAGGALAAGRSFIVVPVADAPAAPANHLLTVNKGGPLAPLGIVSFGDPEGDAFTITVTGLPDAAKGTVFLADGVTAVAVGQTLEVAQLAGLLFRNVPDQAGVAGSFSYRASDVTGQAVERSVAIYLNTPPVAVPDSGVVVQESLPDVSYVDFDVRANDDDIDTARGSLAVSLGTLGVSSTNSAVNALEPAVLASLFSVVDGKVRFTPGTSFKILASGESAVLTAGYAVTDPNGSSSSTNLTFTVVGADKLSLAGGAEAETLAGDADDDVINGGPGGDVIYGRAGGDALIGDAGADTLYGEAGDDRLDGGTENDVLFGGLGNDLLLGRAGIDSLAGEAGADTLYGEDDDDRLDGGDGDDGLFGGRGNDILLGRAGSDTLLGEAGADTLHGEGGDDRLDGGDDADVLFGGDGNDGLLGRAGDDILFGEAGADTLDGADGDDRLDGGADADFLYGGIGNDLLLGRSGNDTLAGESGTDSLYGEAGDDRLDGGAEVDFLFGGIGDDLLLGRLGNDVLLGEAGLDTLYGEDGEDTLDGGADADSLYGGVGNDLLFGRAGNDLLLGEGGLDTLYGEEGNDRLDGGSDADSLYGGIGDDLVLGRLGNDLLFGDAGADIIYGEEGDDRLDGGDDADLLYGGGGNDSLLGRSGNDNLLGEAGNDSLYGEDGSDRLDAGDGADLLYGGAGDDALFGRTGDDTMFGEAGADFLYGEDGSDRLDGGEGADTSYGGIGNDALFGRQGNDILLGEAGADVLAGAEGIDYLYGGEGDDRLDGGVDADVLIGEAGNDLFIFTAGFGQDLIADFGYASGNNDSIQFARSIFANYSEVAAASTQVGADVVIASGANALTLYNVQLSVLTADDFFFA